eukprot:4025067-Ditylum_brightwellii.AAC.2
MEHQDDVICAPPDLSTVHPAVQPLNIAIHTPHGIMGINFTITGMPPLAIQPHTQEQFPSTLHLTKE